jgi:hypothetical protein
MKPTIEYRAAKGKAKASEPPKPKPGGRWVWVPDGKAVTLRDDETRREYQREYMRKRRSEGKP